MAISYLEPIPELSGKKAKQFEEKMKSIKPKILSKNEKAWLETVKIGGQPVLDKNKK